MSIDTIALQTARKIVFALDAARRVSSRENPVHEVELIAAGIEDLIDDLKFEISARDNELAMLKAVYCTPGKRIRKTAKQKEIKALIDKGFTYAEVCERLGIASKSTIHRAVHDQKDASS